MPTNHASPVDFDFDPTPTQLRNFRERQARLARMEKAAKWVAIGSAIGAVAALGFFFASGR